MRFHLLKCWTFLLLFLLATASGRGAEKRVLFIVETSKETKNLAEAERKLVGALIGTGLGGLLEANDTLGVWTFDETLHVGKFPMQRWTPEGTGQVLLRTQDFLKMQTYAKSGRIETVWRPLHAVIQDSPAIMIVLVMSGKQPVSGTPFDEEINSHLKTAYREYQKKKTPAVVVLSATSGKILRYSVNPAIGDVRIPVLTLPTNPPPIKVVQPQPKPQPKVAPSKPVVRTPTETPKLDSDPALIITKKGTRSVSRLEADQIATDNFEAVPPITVQEPLPGLPQLPVGTEIKGPIILNHAVEEVTHAIPIEPPSLKAQKPEPAKLSDSAIAPKNPSPETNQPIAIPNATVTTAPSPVVAAPVVQVETRPASVQQQGKAAAELEKTNSIAPTAVAQLQVEKAPAITPKAEPVPDAAIPSNPPQPEPVTPVVPEKVIPSTQAPETASASTVSTIATNVQSNGPATIQPAPLVAQATPPPSRSSTFLISALVLIFIAVGLAFLVGRKMGTRPQQSLVSDWAERDRLKK